MVQKLVIMSLIPVLASVGLYLFVQRKGHIEILDEKTQIFVGVIFGCIAIMATENAVPMNDTLINVRDAAPLCAGLIFGPLAGIIAGLMGGIERWFCVDPDRSDLRLSEKVHL